MENSDTECISTTNKIDYQNFCSKITDCYQCSHHPYCIFNYQEKLC